MITAQIEIVAPPELVKNVVGSCFQLVVVFFHFRRPVVEGNASNGTIG